MNIKTRIIQANKCRLFIVGGLPKDAEGFCQTHICYGEDPIVYYIGEKTMNFYAPEGVKWEFLGKLGEITEEQWINIVFRSNIGTYKDYSYSVKVNDAFIDSLLTYKFTTAKESGLSLIEANVPLYNKYAKPSELNEFGQAFVPNELYLEDLDTWKKEEEKVFTNPILFIEK